MEHQPAHETMPRRIARSTFSRIGWGLFALMAIQQLVGVLLARLIGYFAPHLTQAGWYVWVISYVPLYLIAYPVMLSIWRTVPDRLPASYQTRRLPLSSFFLLVPGCFTVVYALNLLSTLMAQGLSMVTGSDVNNPLESVLSAGNLWLNLIVVVIVAPVMEELIFRRFLYNKLACFGGGIYVYFSALLFAAFHVNIYQMLYAFVLGVVLAAITYQTGTVRHSVLLHMLINFLGGGGTPLLLHYAGESGLAVYGFVLILILGAGIIAIIRWFYKGRPWLDFGPGRYPSPSVGVMVVNPGVLFYLILIIALTVVTILFA